jgi:thymidylate synthase (FAD)
LISDLLNRRYNVLDEHGYVELQDVMPHPATGVSPDLAVVNAARVSFLGDSKGDDADKKLLRYLIRNRHTSPFEQVEFKFRVCAPVVVWWQWMRHRTWSFNSQSGRYTEIDEKLYFPAQWRRQSTSNKQASDGVIDAEESRLLDAKLKTVYDSAKWFYETALESGVAREQARLFLPGFAVHYEVVAKVDAHNLMHWLSLRDHEHAQFEIREYARAIRTIFAQAMPWTYEAWAERKV